VSFTFTPGELSGLTIIDPPFFADERGFFMESWNARAFQQAGLDLRFAQEGHSRSSRGVLRGLHYQREPHAMGKLVRCTAGRVFDVAVDLRVGSPTFGRWSGLELSGANRRLLWIPEGFAHGFQALEDGSEVQYKMSTFYTPSAEDVLARNDPELAIAWPIAEPLLSPRDARAPGLRDYLAAPAFRAHAETARR
jgi:dTDP-4-dehydrorhamnose 3,5-epimerase